MLNSSSGSLFDFTIDSISDGLFMYSYLGDSFDNFEVFEVGDLSDGDLMGTSSEPIYSRSFWTISMIVGLGVVSRLPFTRLTLIFLGLSTGFSNSFLAAYSFKFYYNYLLYDLVYSLANLACTFLFSCSSLIDSYF